MKNPSRLVRGVNDWNCTPSADHPEPVVLVHGTWENAYQNWNGLAPILIAEGYCVFTPNYGNSTGIAWLNGTADMVESASQVATYVDDVRERTGASQVSLVGHSQGGAQVRYYANLLAPEGTVKDVVMIAATNHATTLSGIKTLGVKLKVVDTAESVFDWVKMPGAYQQSANDSPFFVNVNGNGETVAGVNYTTINTRFEEIVTPYTAGFVTAVPGAQVNNIVIQDVCRVDKSDHLSLVYSKNTAQVVLNALDPAHPHAIRCFVQAPLTGGTGIW